MSWKSVDDELPLLGIDVLVFVKRLRWLHWEEIMIGRTEMVIHPEDNYNVSMKWKVWVSLGVVDLKVLYWMPLPEHPFRREEE